MHAVLWNVERAQVHFAPDSNLFIIYYLLQYNLVNNDIAIIFLLTT